jgi:hypothetical protein
MTGGLGDINQSVELIPGIALELGILGCKGDGFEEELNCGVIL